jgi:antitoxin (DNA-binding transcriptional repressor) of toxin-antitoxin stability system
MKTLNIRQFRASVGQLDQLVEKSGEIIITRNGKPILRVLPVQEKHVRPDHEDLRGKMPLLKTPSSTYIRQERDER